MICKLHKGPENVINCYGYMKSEPQLHVLDACSEYVHDNWMQNLKCMYTLTVVRKIAKYIAAIKVFIDVR